MKDELDKYLDEQFGWLFDLDNQILLAATELRTSHHDFITANTKHTVVNQGMIDACEISLHRLSELGLIDANTDGFKLIKEGILLKAKLPKEYVNRPFDYYLNRLKDDEEANRKQNWKQRNWLLLTMLGFIAGFLANYLLAHLTNDEKQTDRIETHQQTFPKIDSPKLSTTPSLTKNPDTTWKTYDTSTVKL
ncbi:MAG: hypothetical protein JNL72_13880 [Flavipsychrobacter sp.]|nr:hypothetical protein [Flavipsychrobacter sp.]